MTNFNVQVTCGEHSLQGKDKYQVNMKVTSVKVHPRKTYIRTYKSILYNYQASNKDRAWLISPNRSSFRFFYDFFKLG